MLLIGITGVVLNEQGQPVGMKGAGKDTVADMMRDVLEQQGYVVTIWSLAQPLKQLVCQLYGWSASQVNEQKDQPLTHFPGWTPRKLLETIGTDILRAHHPDIWVQELDRLWQRWQLVEASIVDVPPLPPRALIIPDIRFPNEVIWLKQHGGLLCRVQRPVDMMVDPSSLHPSDTPLSWSEIRPHCGIINAGTLDELAQMVRGVMHQFILPTDPPHGSVASES